jgi:hypothetical protein
MMNYVYFLSKKSSFIIYSLVLLTSFLSISISLEGKRNNYEGRTLTRKRRTSSATTPTWIMRFSKINGVGVSILNLFHCENTWHELFIANLISLDQDK